MANEQYSTVPAFIARFGSARVTAIVGNNLSGSAGSETSTIIDTQLQAATAWVEQYLESAGATIPLTAPYPDNIIKIVLEEALYLIFQRAEMGVVNSSDIVKMHDENLRYLESLAAGDLTLPTGISGNTTGSSAATVAKTEKDMTWTDQTEFDDNATFDSFALPGTLRNRFDS